MDAELRTSSVTLFNKLQWLPFYNDTKIAKCALLYKRTQFTVPEYFIDSIKLNSSIHKRNTRFCNYNFVTPKYQRVSEGGRSFVVTAIQLWNSLTSDLKKQSSLKSFKSKMWKSIFDEQLLISHFDP